MKNIGKGLIRVLIIVGFTYLTCKIGLQAMPQIKLGLDLDGGVSITYKADKDNPTPEEMSDAVYKLQLKAQTYSSEAEVYQEGNDRVNIDIPGVSDANAILEELGKPGSLEFVEGYLDFPLLPEYIASGSEIDSSSDTNVVPETTTSAADALKSMLGDSINIEGATVTQNEDGSITIGSGNTDTVQIDNNNVATDSYLRYDYDADPIYMPNQVVISGTDIASAKAGMTADSYNQTDYVVDLVLTDEGRDKFSEATARNIGQPIYIIYNGKIQSAPRVMTQISDGRAQITGMGSYEEANKLAQTIRIGAVPVPLVEIRSNVVGAKLGTDAISTSLKAGAIGLAIVCVFMMIIYLLPGFSASIALVIYTGLILFLLDAFRITLTLPGIAGIILSIGMAVDANVIIFTRIKEEIGLGRSTKDAIKEGYNKALSAILDGNITTLIAAFVLNVKGTGSIKGFAATLALGIVLSMFTALFVTRFILRTLVMLGLDNEKLYGKKVDREPINFVGIRKITYAISIVLIVIGLGFIGFMASQGKPFNYGLDFEGGSSTSITFNEELSLSDIEGKVVPIFERELNTADVQTQKVSGTNQVIIKTRTMSLSEREAIYDILMSSDTDGFNVPEENITTENISGAVSTQMRQDALIAVIIATILMLIYIWFRFKDIRFAGSAVLALLHDCLITIGFYGVFRWTVDSTFIACMLTIVGYSINATIVIFDRIRENLGRMHGKAIDEIVNASITQTFTRSINTSLTTLIMVVCLYVLGVSSIKAFALPLMIGIIAGTYSSICITGPLWFDFKNLSNKKSEQKYKSVQNKK